MNTTDTTAQMLERWEEINRRLIGALRSAGRWYPHLDTHGCDDALAELFAFLWGEIAKGSELEPAINRAAMRARPDRKAGRWQFRKFASTTRYPRRPPDPDAVNAGLLERKRKTWTATNPLAKYEHMEADGIKPDGVTY